MSKDYYSVLGVAKDASKEEIKRAYRKLAHQHHPDKAGGNEDKFKEINEAYQILGDDQKRKQYDQFGSTFSSQGGGAPPGWDFSGFADGGGFEFGGSNLGDIFEDFLGGFSGFRGARGRQKRGSDISIGIDISFSDSVFGTKRNVILEKTSACEACDGMGAEPGTSKNKCDTCQGTGTVRESRKSIFGAFTSLRECDKCHGRGEIPDKPCKVCKGAGVLKKRESIDIEIPPGIQDGEAIKLTGLGEAVSNAAPGDLYVRIHVMRHSIFKREGNDLLMDLELLPTRMILGGEETIETLDGKISVKIPELSKPLDYLRVRGKGIFKSRSTRGDLLIRLLPKVPKKISSHARKLLSDLEREGL